MELTNTPTRRSLLLLLPAVAGVAVLLVVTRRGVFVSPDGLAYVGTARNLLGGNGYTSPPGSPPLGNFPPLYPLLLAAVGAFGPDPLTVARYLNPILFGAVVLLAGLLTRRLTGSLRLAVAAQLLVVAGFDFLSYASTALSEPLFLVLVLAALAALVRGLDRRTPGTLLVAAVLAAAACLTRYLGVTVVAAGAVALLVLGGRRRRAWRGSVAFAAIALAPLLGWFAWVASVEGRATNRAAVLHLPGADYLLDGLRSASTWVLPRTFGLWVRAVAAVAAVAALVLVARRAHRPRRAQRVGADAPRDAGNAPAGLLALFALAYLAALAVDRSLFDVTGRLDARFLLPLHVVAVALGLWALRGVDLRRAHAARIALSAVVGLQLAAGGQWAYDAVTDESVRPAGFTAEAWEDSAVIDLVRATPPGTPIYSNGVDVLWFHTGRVAMPVPEKREFLTSEPNPAYEAELAAMAEGLRAGALLVYFTHPPARRVFLPTAEELERQPGLVVVRRDEVGVAYRRRG